MNTEKRSFTVIYGVFDINEVARHRSAFGWKAVSFDSAHVYMERSLDANNGHVLSLEAEYEEALEKYREYASKARGDDFVNEYVYILFYMLIIPAVIYHFHKKKMRNNANEELNKMVSIVDKSQALLNI